MPHDEHVERCIERICHFGRDWHTAARQTEDDQVQGPAVAEQAQGEFASCFVTIGERELPETMRGLVRGVHRPPPVEPAIGIR